MPTKTRSRGPGRPPNSSPPSTVTIDGQTISVRPALVPLINHLLKNEGKLLSQESIAAKLGLKEMTVRYYMVDARLAFTTAGRTITTVKGEGVRLEAVE